MDFKLDKSHLLQQELFRRFAETEIKPLAKEMDEKEAYDLCAAPASTTSAPRSRSRNISVP